MRYVPLLLYNSGDIDSFVCIPHFITLFHIKIADVNKQVAVH